MKSPHTYLLLLALAWLPLFSKKLPTDYNGNIFTKNGVTLTPTSIYYNGLLQSVSSPQLAGYLDQSFKATGYEIMSLTIDQLSTSLALQPDGKILLAGTTNDHYSIIRLNPNGSLDTTFNPTGDTPGTYTLPQFTNNAQDICYSLLLQTDGKIVLSGSSTVGGPNFYSIARLTTNGSLDTTFNTTGPLPGTYILPPFGASTSSTSFGATLQPDGKIVLSGQSLLTRSRYSIARLNSDGSLDGTFNPTGITSQAGTFILPQLTGSTSDVAYGIALSSDGSIVLAGFSLVGTNRYSVARLTSTGALDITFNATGAVQGTYILPTFTGSNRDYAGDLQLQADGKIILAGTSRIAGLIYFSFARINTNGSLDTTFNSAQIGGTQQGTFVVKNFTTNVNFPTKTLTLQPDGKILFAGAETTGQEQYAIVRLTPDGSLDTSFGPTGSGLSTLPTFNGSIGDQAQAIALTQNGTIILGGYSSFAGAIYRYSLAQLTNNYTLTQYQTEYPGQGGFY